MTGRGRGTRKGCNRSPPTLLHWWASFPGKRGPTSVGSVRSGHQERPQREIAKAHTHPHPSGMSCTNKPIGAKGDEHCRCDPTQGVMEMLAWISATSDTTNPTESACPTAIGGRAFQTAERRCSCSPNATAKSQPIPGFMPWKAPSPSSASHGHASLTDSRMSRLSSRRPPAGSDECGNRPVA